MARATSHLPFPQGMETTWAGRETTGGTCTEGSRLSGVVFNQQPPETQSFLPAIPNCINADTVCTGLGVPGAPPAAGAAAASPCLQGRNSTPFLPVTQTPTRAPKWRSGWKHPSLSSESNKFLSPYLFKYFQNYFFS